MPILENPHCGAQRRNKTSQCMRPFEWAFDFLFG
jgi:hypothetical protein